MKQKLGNVTKWHIGKRDMNHVQSDGRSAINSFFMPLFPRRSLLRRERNEFNLNRAWTRRRDSCLFKTLSLFGGYSLICEKIPRLVKQPEDLPNIKRSLWLKLSISLRTSGAKRWHAHFYFCSLPSALVPEDARFSLSEWNFSERLADGQKSFS